jgi:hypothetical protein
MVTITLPPHVLEPFFICILIAPRKSGQEGCKENSVTVMRHAFRQAMTGASESVAGYSF